MEYQPGQRVVVNTANGSFGGIVNEINAESCIVRLDNGRGGTVLHYPKVKKDNNEEPAETDGNEE